MGAALTYARRYALFTLVGIAGDDDLDAPDLSLQSEPSAASVPPRQVPSPPRSHSLRAKAGKSQPPKSIVTLELAASGQQRDELLLELDSIVSFDAAAQWAKRIIPIKNPLTAEHAREVEGALEVNLTQVGTSFGEATQTSEPPITGGQAQPEANATTLATADRST